MKNTITTILFLFIMIGAKSQSMNNVYLIVNNKSDIREVQNFVEKIYTSAKFKLTSFTIVHYNSSIENPATWNFNKQQIDYKPTTIDCDFDACSSLKSLINFAKTEKSKLFFCEKQLKCEGNNFGIETTVLSNQLSQTIADKIVEEVQINKSVKRKVTLFFYLGTDEQISKPTVKFKSDTLNVKFGELVTLVPEINGDYSKLEWSPKEGLSCSNCPNPQVTANSKFNYSLVATSEQGCSSNAASISIVPFNECDCVKSTKKLEAVFGKTKIPKYQKMTAGIDLTNGWKIISNETGEYVVDILCTANCASNFEVIIYNQKKQQIWSENYATKDINQESKNNYLDRPEHKDKFCFRLDLNEIEEQLDHSDEYFNMEIISTDEQGNTCKPYQSPNLIFMKCQ